MKKIKVFKNCINCSFKVKNLCEGNINNEFCLNWLPKQASCANCLRIRICLNKNKDVSEKFICSDFERNKFPISIREVKEDIDLLKNEDDDEELYSPISSIENIITKDFHPSSFSKIDDSDISRAENDIDFILNPNFMGIELFPKQLVANMEFLGSNCPYCSDNKFIKKVEVDTPLDEILDRSVLYDRWGVCPKCKKTRYDAYEDKKLRFYKDMIGICGQRSGKSVNTAILSALITYKYLMLADPCDFFPGILRGTTLHGTFVSLTFGQAFDNLWQPYYELLIGTKWFKEYTSFLMEAGEKAGRELVKIRDTFVIFHNKSICVTEDTLIDTEYGLIQIKDLYEFLDKGIKVKGINGKLRNCGVLVNSGKHKTIKITTEYGYEVEGTFNHPILTITPSLDLDWKYLSNIKKGDYIAINTTDSPFPKELLFDYKIDKPKYEKVHEYILKKKYFTTTEIKDVFEYPGVYSHFSNLELKGLVHKKKNKERTKKKEPLFIYYKTSKFSLKSARKFRGWGDHPRYKVIIPNKMTPDLASILGYMVSDGWYNKNWGFGNTNKTVNKDFKIKFKKVFNINLNFYKGGKVNKQYYQTYILYKEIQNFLRYVGLNKTVAGGKEIPWSILRSSKPCVVSFLKSLFEGDGCTSISGVSYVSVSKNLRKQLQILLLKFGIVCNDFGKNIDFTTKGSRRFFDEIGFFTKQKSNIFNSRKMNNGSKESIIPYVSFNIKKCLGKNNRYRTYMRSGNNLGAFATTSLSKEFHKENISSDYFRTKDTNNDTILSSIRKKDKQLFLKLKKLVTLNVCWLKVDKTTISKNKKQVYDISVEHEEHAFTGNGIICHNTIYPSGPDKRKLRGRTRFLSSIDEISWFWGTEKAIKYDPDEIYEALDNSLMTVYAGSKRVFPKHPYTPTAYGIYISSPSSKTDKGMRMLQLSKSSKSIYGFHSATWNFNPNITREDLADKFSSDPVRAERDFGANPPHSSSPFISSPAMIIPSFSNKRNLLGLDQHRIIRDSLGGKLLAPKVIIRNTHTFPSILGIDSGWNNNSFACVLQHYLDEERTRIGVSGIIEMMPTSYPLSFPDIYEDVISPIIENFNISIVVADRWQSIDLTQRIYQDYEIDALMYTIKYPDFEYIRSKILSEDFKFPRLERKLKDLINVKRSISDLIVNSPVSHLFLQMLMVNDTGRTVTKGDECTDDVFRAFAIGSSILLDPEYEDLFGGGGKENSYQVSNMIVVANKSMPFQQGMSQGQSQAPSGIGVVSGKSSNFQQGSMGALGGR